MEGHGGALDFFTWELQIPYMGEEEVKNFFFFLHIRCLHLLILVYILFLVLFNFYYVWGGYSCHCAQTTFVQLHFSTFFGFCGLNSGRWALII